MRDRPLVIFDGKCAFCRIWIEYFQALTGDRVDYAPSQQVAGQFPQISPVEFSRSVQLVAVNGQVHSGARAAFEILRYSPGGSWLASLYRAGPLFAALSEGAYRIVAANRTFFFHFTRVLFGRQVLPASFFFTEWLFIRALAGIYLIAFVSFGTQIRGLIGSHGILPVHAYLQALEESFQLARYWVAPSLFWFRHDDGFLVFVCIAGGVLSVLLLFGFAQRVLLVLLFLFYLSLCSVGQDFMSFQWDMLLLEAGFLAVFLGSSKLVVWLFRWLLFRLIFLSGCVKLMSHDTAWRGLEAIRFHYWTQPLPTPVAWYLNQMPDWFQRASTALVLFGELLVPILILAPRRARHFAGYCMVILQLLILITGNYTFFNILAIALCLFLFDDRRLGQLRFQTRSPRHMPKLVVTVAVVIAIISGSQWIGTFFDFIPAPGRALLRLAAPFGIVNTYGLFAVMTTERTEIILQGSSDGANWIDYTFLYKPGKLTRPPAWVAPFQPRLDWQMWFAALSNWRANPWFANLMVRLLEGSPDVLALMQESSFAGAPPKYVRALMYNYRFTNFAERRLTGEWWHREPKGVYFPSVSLSDVGKP